jgi:hypothetical protein
MNTEHTSTTNVVLNSGEVDSRLEQRQFKESSVWKNFVTFFSKAWDWLFGSSLADQANKACQSQSNDSKNKEWGSLLQMLLHRKTSASDVIDALRRMRG